jgi:hypothetical protein
MKTKEEIIEDELSKDTPLSLSNYYRPSYYYDRYTIRIIPPEKSEIKIKTKPICSVCFLLLKLLKC